ncbi:29331_t:CDS:2, partial [Racocetra persica]
CSNIISEDIFEENISEDSFRKDDGHILSEGMIIIMTTNHIEHLDPACICPGRMDIYLELGYCTYFQIKKMYKKVTKSSDVKFPTEILQQIPERLLPPCAVMITMMYYRNEINLIPEKILKLVNKYQQLKSVDFINKIESKFTKWE